MCLEYRCALNAAYSSFLENNSWGPQLSTPPPYSSNREYPIMASSGNHGLQRLAAN